MVAMAARGVGAAVASDTNSKTSRISSCDRSSRTASRTYWVSRTASLTPCLSGRRTCLQAAAARAMVAAETVLAVKGLAAVAATTERAASKAAMVATAVMVVMAVTPAAVSASRLWVPEKRRGSAAAPPRGQHPAPWR
eukprot:scaffold12480_cov63-Phaeocystis_antarctica.AAC.3